MEEFDIGYLEANASKYVMRYDRKGVPLIDLGKAKSYLLRLLESRQQVHRVIPLNRLFQFYEANDMDAQKRAFFNMVHLKGDLYALREAVVLIDYLMKAPQS